MSLLNSPTMVAAVTAASTLVASALTGWITLRAQRRQLGQQAALAAEERAEQLKESRREERKAAYSEFITQAVRTADSSLAMCRADAGDPAVFERVRAEARAHLAELWPMLALVNILGPEDIAALADRVPHALQREMRAAERHPGGPLSAISDHSDARQQAQRAFASAVRALMEGVSTPPPAQV
ncbi:hypothetical protein AB0C96_00350 [Streptomyces sp. NPDC048506]|uniref:hypothetical protein n=1 Tax=Streptomyces sp. NPDC048506 TaxID=3155028 RepID=UPI0034249D13